MKKEILQSEQDNLQEVIDVIEDNIRKLKDKARNKRLSKEVLDDAFVRRRLQQNKQARENLYIGRLDFIDDGKNESYYIGENPVEKNHNENVILDWRSPIADAFYSFFGGEGETFYNVPNTDKEQRITILLKRNIDIKRDRVMKYQDILSDDSSEYMDADKDTTGYEDTFLQSLLSETSEGSDMKNIIATIQKEQNEIIRMQFGKTAIIQGVAGSGKSTVALHRISYLLYRHRDSLSPKDILIIAPNIIFLKYMQSLLPSLEINDIEQHTFVTLAKEIVPEINKEVEVPFLTLANIVDGHKGQEEVSMISNFKGSVRFKEIIDSYLQSFEKNLINTIAEFSITHPLTEEELTYSKKDIQVTLNSLKYMPMELRREEVRKSIESWKNETHAIIIEDLESELEYAKTIWVNPLTYGSYLRREMLKRLEEVHEHKKTTLKKIMQTKWKSYTGKWKRYKSMDIYKNILNPKALVALDSNIDSDIVDKLGNEITTYDDLAPLIYIEKRLLGLNKSFKHIVIDEAQDLNPFQFAVLKLFTSSMTIIGDVTQSVYPQTGITQWESIIPDVFSEDKIKRGDMTVSYRSTVEIMDTANKIITSGNLPYPKIVPVRRNGDKVKIKEIIDDTDLLEGIFDSLKLFSSKSYQRIAIVHKDTERCEELYYALSDEGLKSLEIILDPRQEMTQNISIIPTYLVKGLEFDAVIIPNANDDNYAMNELDAKLLFISATRAHHDLHIYYHRQLTPLLKGCEVIEAKRKRKRFSIL